MIPPPPPPKRTPGRDTAWGGGGIFGDLLRYPLYRPDSIRLPWAAPARAYAGTFETEVIATCRLTRPTGAGGPISGRQSTREEEISGSFRGKPCAL